MAEMASPAPQDAMSQWQAFRDRVARTRERLEEVDPRVSLYALIDTRATPDLREALERLGSVPFADLWEGSDLSAYRDIAPLLVRVDSGLAETEVSLLLLKRLWRFFMEAHMVTWFWAPHALDDLACHLRTFREYTLPDHRSFYLHFYDSRILERLRRVWSPEEWDRFAAVAYEGWYRNRAGDEVCWTSDAIEPPAAAPIPMTTEQHLALLSLGYPDKVAMQLAEIYGSLLGHLSRDALHAAVETQIQRAMAHGISEEQDMFRYVAKGLLISPRFDEDADVQKGLESARFGYTTFAAALEQVDESIDIDGKGMKPSLGG